MTCKAHLKRHIFPPNVNKFSVCWNWTQCGRASWKDTVLLNGAPIAGPGAGWAGQSAPSSRPRQTLIRPKIFEMYEVNLNSSHQTQPQCGRKSLGRWVHWALVMCVFKCSEWFQLLSCPGLFPCLFQPNPHKPQPDCNTTKRCTGPNHSSLLHIHQQTLSQPVAPSGSYFSCSSTTPPSVLFCCSPTFCLPTPSSVSLFDSFFLFFLVLAGCIAAAPELKVNKWSFFGLFLLEEE